MRSSIGTASHSQGLASAGAPWQLRMFSKSIKKRQKVALLLRQLGATEGKACLLVTNGDNNGVLNYWFRAHGGDWTWVENEARQIPEMEAFLGEEVWKGSGSRIPAEDARFDVVVSIDVHEHLDDCGPFNRELCRVAKPGATVVVTTPNGDPWKPVTVLKNLVGMTKEKYGHVVIGYNVAQHTAMLSEAGLRVEASGSYSKLFSELLELGINFAYVAVLSRKRGAEVPQGTIAPTSRDQMKSVEKQLRLYSAVYPLFRLVSGFDLLLFPFTGYAVSVVARKPG
ncbi:MAG: methyltransferase domain-containing protein [Deferrisomatales bacterium]|nr:methyltransferase domain-containing protein [Deferrisomatales bacterium]